METTQALPSFTPNPNELNCLFGADSVSNILAFFALILSVIGLIVSIYYSKKAYMQAFNINKVNIEVDYYKKIFDEYIISIIPEKRKKLSFGANNILTRRSLMDFDQMLIDLLGAMQFFSFRNQDFYNKMKNIIMELDDYIVNNAYKTMNSQQKALFFHKVDIHINNLYSEIFETCLGEI